MNKLPGLKLVLIGLFIYAGATGVKADSKSIEARLIAYRSKELQSTPLSPIEVKILSDNFNSSFSSDLEDAHLRLLDGDSLRKVFELTNDVLFYSSLHVHLTQMQAVFSELERRHLAGAVEIRKMYDAFFQLREFDLARHFADSHDSYLGQQIPTVLTSDKQQGEAKWLKVEGSNLLRIETVQLGSGPHVVVVAHPFCHFSREAVHSIEQDSLLKSRFKGALWVTPQDARLEIDAIQSWNETIPFATLHLMFDVWEWPLTDIASTPVFTFLRNGTVVTTVRGWPGDQQKNLLLDAFAKLHEHQ